MIRTIDLSDRPPLRRIWLIVAAWAVLAMIQAMVLRYQQNVRFEYALASSKGTLPSMNSALRQPSIAA